ncbi:MAG TPA: hypothetical protein VNM92_00605 [Thermoanaerobaculia bacterium]|nr:hypothetical protein [Thermoanaerobaculia bacterium]
MNSRMTIGVILLASFVVIPAVIAHDPREHKREAEEQMTRVPVQIESVPVAQPQPVLPKIRFHGMDSNRDRTISHQEWRGTTRNFRALDRNRDGILSGDEVATRTKAEVKAKAPAKN